MRYVREPFIKPQLTQSSSRAPRVGTCPLARHDCASRTGPERLFERTFVGVCRLSHFSYLSSPCPELAASLATAVASTAPDSYEYHLDVVWRFIARIFRARGRHFACIGTRPSPYTRVHANLVAWKRRQQNALPIALPAGTLRLRLLGSAWPRGASAAFHPLFSNPPDPAEPRP